MDLKYQITVCNLKKKMDSSLQTIVVKYSDLTNEYITAINDSVKIKNNNHFIFLIHKGLSCISIIYGLLLLYTNNLNLSYYHTKRGIYYYIEYIEQILSSKNYNLNLSSQNALLFVYKKTIFDFNTIASNDKIHHKIKIIITTYNNLLIQSLNINNMTISDSMSITLKNICVLLCKCKSVKKLEHIMDMLNNEIEIKTYFQKLKSLLKIL